MLKQSESPYDYRNLLVYQKTEELQVACAYVTRNFPKSKTFVSLADQMNRSARSVKQNVVEGWKRNTTGEYHQFLGYAVASNAELEEDCNDIWKGIYSELREIKGVMGEKWEETGKEKGEKWEGTGKEKGEKEKEEKEVIGKKEAMEKKGERVENGEVKVGGADGNVKDFDIESIPFYPINTHLPPIVQLKLRAKELNFLLHKLQKSLVDKMSKENTLSVADKMRRFHKQQKEQSDWYDKVLTEQGLVRLESGQVVKKNSTL